LSAISDYCQTHLHLNAVTA